MAQSFKDSPLSGYSSGPPVASGLKRRYPEVNADHILVYLAACRPIGQNAPQRDKTAPYFSIRSCFDWGLPSQGVTPLLVGSYPTVSLLLPLEAKADLLFQWFSFFLFCGTFLQSPEAAVSGQSIL